MRLLGTIDLEILHVAVANGGTINESHMEDSQLKRLGVGRILDALASLRDRDMLVLNRDGSFLMTDAARNTLWNDGIPLWARILRLLEVRPCSPVEISTILQVQEHDETYGLLDELQKRRFIMITPQIRDGRPEKIYEILPDGIDRLAKSEGAGLSVARMPSGPSVLGTIDDISGMIEESQTLSSEEKRIIGGKISGLRSMLEESTARDTSRHDQDK